jgi:hypothetical protein
MGVNSSWFPPDGIGHLTNLSHFRDIMDSQNVCSTGDRGTTGGGSTPDAFLRVRLLQDVTNKTFAGGAD